MSNYSIHKLPDGPCGLCGEPVDRALVHPHPDSPCVDHIKQRVEGGTDDLDNLRVVHFVCNARRKRALPPRLLAPIEGYQLFQFDRSFAYFVPLC